MFSFPRTRVPGAARGTSLTCHRTTVGFGTPGNFLQGLGGDEVRHEKCSPQGLGIFFFSPDVDFMKTEEKKVGD